jgi:GAF domain-containing protein
LKTIRIYDTRQALIAACALGVLVVGICALAATAVPSAALVVIPLLVVSLAEIEAVAVAAAGALALVLAGGLVAGEFLEAAHLAALVAVGAGGGTAMWLAVEESAVAREHERDACLAESSSLLSSSIDYETTVRTAASVPVPWLADWCVLDLAEPGGAVRRRAVSHAEPEPEEIAWRLGEGYESSAELLSAARAQLWSEIPDSLLVAVARDEQHLADLRALGTGSAMIVPLRTVGGTIGVMTLGSRTPGRFSPEDVELAQDLARRCAIAIENAELYRSAVRSAGGRFRREAERRSPTTPNQRGTRGGS